LLQQQQTKKGKKGKKTKNPQLLTDTVEREREQQKTKTNKVVVMEN
jgi:hypothetical protein